MNYNVNENILDLKGNDLFAKKECAIIDKTGELVLEEGVPKLINVPTKEVLTVKTLCISGLLNNSDVKGSEKHKRYTVAKKLQESNGSVKLAESDILLIKDVIGKLYVPLIVGQVYEALKEKK